MTSFKFRVVLNRIRLFPTLISKIKWLRSELPLNEKSVKSWIPRSGNSWFNFKVGLCRIRVFPTLISKIKWFWSQLPLTFWIFFRNGFSTDKSKNPWFIQIILYWTFPWYSDHFSLFSQKITHNIQIITHHVDNSPKRWVISIIFPNRDGPRQKRK